MKLRSSFKFRNLHLLGFHRLHTSTTDRELIGHRIYNDGHARSSVSGAQAPTSVPICCSRIVFCPDTVL
ncbi:unnamed protein product [Allacma fusca]|uniref:Uncharacterized protein n=1 Tax=Allacma fusca TaxID=39272 RepID=A0A8J2LIH4_9HEXA|nr:unnamed protein product [Allacma fusca]